MIFSIRFALSIFLLSFYLHASSQPQITIKQGEMLEPEKNARFKHILGVDAESFYILRIKTRGIGTKYFVERYDKKNFSLLFSSDLLLDEVPGAQTDPAKVEVNSFSASGKVYVFFRGYHSDSKERVLYVKSVDKSGTVSAEKEISTVVSETEAVNFNLAFSPDRTKIAIITEVRQHDSPQDVKVNLYNASNLEFIRKITLPRGYKRGGIYTANYLLDEGGNLYFSFNYLTDKDEVGLGLGSIPAKSSEMKAAEIVMPLNKEIYNGMIKFNKTDNSITFSGMYKDVIDWKGKAKDKPEKKAGVFSFRINIADFSIVAKSDKPFTPNVYEKLNYGDALISQAPGDKYYSAEQLLEVNEDNYFVSCHSYAVYNGSTSYSVSRELVVTKISKTGEIEWMKVIPKYTASISAKFNTIVVNNKIYFFFLDHPKNAEKFPDPENYIPKDLKAASGFTGPNAVCFSIDAAGKIERSVFYKNEGFCYVPTFDDYLLDKNSLLIRFVKGESEKFGMITVK